MPLTLCYYGNPILRQHCKKIAVITDEIRQLAREMIEMVDRHNAGGLAAPQVGRPLRLFIARTYTEDEAGNWSLSNPQVYINPRLISHSEECCVDMEGCLSIPGLRVEVERPCKIQIEAMDLEGQLFTEDLGGDSEVSCFNARVRLHENDHINGTLMIDRMDPKERKALEPALKALKEKYSS